MAVLTAISVPADIGNMQSKIKAMEGTVHILPMQFTICIMATVADISNAAGYLFTDI